jgi:hypothetical protein
VGEGDDAEQDTSEILPEPPVVESAGESR